MLDTLDRMKLKYSVNIVTSNSSKIKLATLLFPTLSSIINEWLTFSDLFKTVVIDNESRSS